MGHSRQCGKKRGGGRESCRECPATRSVPVGVLLGRLRRYRLPTILSRETPGRHLFSHKSPPASVQSNCPPIQCPSIRGVETPPPHQTPPRRYPQWCNTKQHSSSFATS